MKHYERVCAYIDLDAILHNMDCMKKNIAKNSNDNNIIIVNRDTEINNNQHCKVLKFYEFSNIEKPRNPNIFNNFTSLLDEESEDSSMTSKVEKDNISVTKDTIIKTLHDTIIQLDTKIVEINKNNEEIRNTIINQSVDSDCVFFAEYLQISESNK